MLEALVAIYDTISSHHSPQGAYKALMERGASTSGVWHTETVDLWKMIIPDRGKPSFETILYHEIKFGKDASQEGKTD